MKYIINKSSYLTDRKSSFSFECYLKTISGKEYEPLTKEEEVELLQHVYEKEKWAMDKLIKHNLRFVVMVAKNYTFKKFNFIDVVNVGNIGLMKAVERVKPEYNNKFITYAVWWIKQSIAEFLRHDNNCVRLPANIDVIYNKIKKVKIKLQNILNREPTIEEIYEKIPDISIENIKLCLKSQYLNDNLLSLDLEFSDHETTLKDIIEDKNTIDFLKDNIYNNERKNYIDELLKSLPKKDRFILIHRFGLEDNEEKKLNVIAELLYNEGYTNRCLTAENVRKSINKSLKKLKLNSLSKNYLDYI